MVEFKENCALKLVIHPELDHYINIIDKQYLQKLAEELNAHLDFETNDSMHINDFHFYSTITNKRIEV